MPGSNCFDSLSQNTALAVRSGGHERTLPVELGNYAVYQRLAISPVRHRLVVYDCRLYTEDEVMDWLEEMEDAYDLMESLGMKTEDRGYESC